MYSAALDLFLTLVLLAAGQPLPAGPDRLAAPDQLPPSVGASGSPPVDLSWLVRLAKRDLTAIPRGSCDTTPLRPDAPDLPPETIYAPLFADGAAQACSDLASKHEQTIMEAYRQAKADPALARVSKECDVAVTMVQRAARLTNRCAPMTVSQPRTADLRRWTGLALGVGARVLVLWQSGKTQAALALALDHLAFIQNTSFGPMPMEPAYITFRVWAATSREVLRLALEGATLTEAQLNSLSSELTLLAQREPPFFVQAVSENLYGDNQVFLRGLAPPQDPSVDARIRRLPRGQQPPPLPPPGLHPTQPKESISVYLFRRFRAQAITENCLNQDNVACYNYTVHLIALEQAFLKPQGSIQTVLSGIVELGLPYYMAFVVASKFQPVFHCPIVPFNSQHQRYLTLLFLQFHIACELYAIQFGNPPTPGNFTSDKWKPFSFNPLCGNDLAVTYDGDSVTLEQTYPPSCDSLARNPWATYRFALKRTR